MTARNGHGCALPPLPLEAFGLFAPEHQAWVAPRIGARPLRTKLEPVRLSDPAAAALPRTYLYDTAPASGPFDPFAERFRHDPVWPFREVATGHDARINAPKRCRPSSPMPRPADVAERPR